MDLKNEMFFLNEAQGHLGVARETLEKLDAEKDNSTHLQNLIYTFQALQALAPAAELDQTAKFCQIVVNYLQKKKDKGIPDNKLVKFKNMILDSLEKIEKVLENLDDMESSEFLQVNTTINELDSEYDITFIRPLTAEELESLKQHEIRKPYQIFIRIGSSCKFKKVRLFFIFRSLNSLGQICWTNPEPKVLERSEFETDFYIFLLTEASEEDINDKLEEILEIEQKLIKVISFETFEKEINLLEEEKEEPESEPTEEITEIDEDEIDFFTKLTLEEFEELEKDRKNIFYRIYVRVKLNCKQRKLRLYLVLKELYDKGKIIWSKPNPKILLGGNFDLDFEIYFVSLEHKRTISEEIKQIAEISTISISEIGSSEFKKIIPSLETRKEKHNKKPRQKTEEVQEKQKEEPVMNIVFTNKIENPEKIIRLSEKEFFKLVKSNNITMLFSAYQNKEDAENFLYAIKEGFYFVPECDDYSSFSEFFKIDGNYKDFLEFLEEQKFA